MIDSVEFKNFKALRNATLPLSRFTLIVGPNGSGKSTALLGLSMLRRCELGFDQVRTAGVGHLEDVVVAAHLQEGDASYLVTLTWKPHASASRDFHVQRAHPSSSTEKVQTTLSRIRTFALDATEIARSLPLQPNIELQPNGSYLAVVLDRLRDQYPERFETLNQELNRWLPEFDRVLFETPQQGHRSIALRTREQKHVIKADDLSQGTLIALALLTLAYLPDPPSIICLEEPDHGLHPRLLRDVRDAIYRLAYPESVGEKRDSVQVIATTHNPYFLDLFRQHPEEIVIAEKVGLEATFSRLSDRSDLDEILGDAHLGEVWYSGVLGGVPAGT